MLRHELHAISSSKRDLRNFGLVVGGVLLLLGILLLWRGRGSAPVFLVCGITMILAGVLSPSVLKPLHRPWMMAAVALGWLSTRIILSVLFYAIMTPISFLARISGKRFLSLKPDSSLKSYWNYREHKEWKPEEYERQF
jgi:hypothetical protein